MATILRVKLRWSGFQGGPGYSIFHFRDFNGGGDLSEQVEGAASRVDTFAADLTGVIARGVQLQVMTDVEEIEETNGQLMEIHNASAKTAKNATASAGTAYAAAVGAVVNWRTGSVRNGRRVRGKTFLVPLSGSSFEDNGTLNASHLGQITTAATKMIDGTGTPDLGVYARPSSRGATDGAWSVATSFSVPDMGAVLRSRRD